ncbi:MAG: hypothetical protein JW910_00260, partial [Anaerolineae bacterium]|nr:hypothetical protein [Anaerolineae bacterium]
MIRMIRHALCVFVVIAFWGGDALPASQAQQPVGSLVGISGSYTTTNPVYPLIGADAGVLLYDLAGKIQQDYAFVPTSEAQVLGQMNGSIASGTYQIDLPDTPQGTLLDFDGDAATPPAVQVFAAATYLNYLGDATLSRGERPLGLSVRLAPLSEDITGGYLIVWAAQADEWFPNGFGRDGALFTGDEPLTLLPAGWSVVSLESDPFRIIREDAPDDIPIVEATGALNDFSDLSYEDAWNRLFQRVTETYPFSAEKSLDWELIYNEVTPLVRASTSP